MKELKNEKYQPQRETLQVHREDILYREDIKATFGYGIIALTAAVGAVSLIYLVIKQLKKD
jgi:hypothetical protein